MKQLPSDTVRLLSSSQVITSVVNVVKELIENSLDAGASSIDIKMENFGLDRIEVRDNGEGIRATDAPVMALRHFTSKICSHEDLEHLESYGFRGEALGSICAVAEVTVTTKTAADDVSTQYTLDSTGTIVCQKPSHLGAGTSVAVLKLFRNLPVRRQYYSNTKKCKEELRKVQDLLMAYAILKPQLRLMLVHNKVVLWQKARVADNRSGLIATLGSSVAANMLPCHQEQAEIVLDGFLPNPGADVSSTSYSHADRTFLFINDRPVQHKEIIKLLRQHYSAQYSDESVRQRYPILVLKINVLPSSLDVNVTPDKTQVLLHNKEAVLTAIEALLVSLYGFRPDLPSEKQTDSSEQGTGHKAGADVGSLDGSSPTEERKRGDLVHADTSLDRQASNCSSSSSVADDWILNQIQVEEQSNFSLCDNDVALSSSKTTQARKDPDTLEEGNKSATESNKRQISAEDWSRGTALTDRVSGKPLQPVIVHQPAKTRLHDADDALSSNKKMFNAVTEKPAALTAYNMISNSSVRAPLTAVALFEREARPEVLKENPSASLQDISSTLREKWRNLSDDRRHKYEERAKRSQEHHHQKANLASAEVITDPGEKTPRTNRTQGLKRKTPLSNQQLLDQLFSAQKKSRTPASKPWQPLTWCMASLRLRLQRLWSQSATTTQGLRVVSRLACQSTWVVLSGQQLMVLNPFRVEEALLFKKLLESNILPTVTLQKPVRLTDRNLGGAEYLKTLCNMEKHPPELDGSILFSDPRLVANGFKIKIHAGLVSAEKHLEVTAMADCIPFFGVEDLREVLTAVLHSKSSTVQDCRPLKVTNYLQAEAVRLVRQMPSNMSREDVEETLRRMELQLDGANWTCIHGRPFLQPLAAVPSSDQEAKTLCRSLEL